MWKFATTFAPLDYVHDLLNKIKYIELSTSLLVSISFLL
jgi:hypothetical protein